MKYVLFVLISIIALSLCNSSSALAQQPIKKHNHEVPLDSAKKFIKNLDKDAMRMKINGGLYSREIFDKILSQKGVTGIRFYYAKLDNGDPTLVAVGVDSLGRDMTTGTIAEAIFPCPPYCDQTSELVK